MDTTALPGALDAFVLIDIAKQEEKVRKHKLKKKKKEKIIIETFKHKLENIEQHREEKTFEELANEVKRSMDISEKLKGFFLSKI